jgi:putative ubiquitin-RnfH superfamily antitoxin RatB of RatAB toxin-antitoxin module
MPEPGGDFVEVVYALPDRQDIVRVPWIAGLTAVEAVRLSGLPEACPEIVSRPLVLGVFGTRVALDHRLGRGDRVEICRPLQADPRELRRMLASRGAVMGQGPGGGVKKQD